MIRNRSLRAAFLLAAAASLLLLAGAPALASDAGEQAAPGETSMKTGDGLDPVEARRLRFLFWGYAAFWILTAGYLVTIGFRLRGVRREIDRLRERLDGRPGAAAGGPPQA